MIDDNAQLKDGSSWAEHEDFLIGNEAGLNNLIEACKEALQNGKYHGDGLGDYVGIKKIENSWFSNQKEQNSSKPGTLVLAAIAIVGLFLLLVGAYTAVIWLYHLVA